MTRPVGKPPRVVFLWEQMYRDVDAVCRGLNVARLAKQVGVSQTVLYSMRGIPVDGRIQEPKVSNLLSVLVYLGLDINSYITTRSYAQEGSGNANERIPGRVSSDVEREISLATRQPSKRSSGTGRRSRRSLGTNKETPVPQ